MTKYHTCSCESIKINKSGKCTAEQPSFLYPIHKVWSVMRKSNFIDMLHVNDDDNIRLGIYYIGEIFDLKLVFQKHGTWQWVQFVTEDNDEPLTMDDIIQRPINEKRFEKLCKDYYDGNIPTAKKPERKIPENKHTENYNSGDFGWLSPSGVFLPSDHGEHEKSALKIIQEKGQQTEYNDFIKDKGNTARDFLIEKKHYALIHNPSGDGGIIVSHPPHITKMQKEFLYNYFYAMKNYVLAESYLYD